MRGGDRDRNGDYLIAEHIHDDLVVTTLTDTSTGCCGYLITEYAPGDAEGRIRSFVDSADQAARRFFEMTGCELTTAEMGAA